MQSRKQEVVRESGQEKERKKKKRIVRVDRLEIPMIYEALFQQTSYLHLTKIHLLV